MSLTDNSNTESKTETEPVSEPQITVDDDTPQWASFDFGATDGDVVEVIPNTLKKIRGAQPEGSKKTKRQLSAAVTSKNRLTDKDLSIHHQSSSSKRIFP